MANEDGYGAAVHEAGHVVVAWALGLKTRKMAVDGDEAAGAAEIEEGTHLPLVDQIAICWAGAGAQRLLAAPTNAIAAFADMVRIRDLINDLGEDDGEALRSAGYRRSQELLKKHRATLECLAQALAERTELNQFEIGEILIFDGRST